VYKKQACISDFWSFAFTLLILRCVRVCVCV